jgi:hypothetical protein
MLKTRAELLTIPEVLEMSKTFPAEVTLRLLKPHLSKRGQMGR